MAVIFSSKVYSRKGEFSRNYLLHNPTNTENSKHSNSHGTKKTENI